MASSTTSSERTIRCRPRQTKPRPSTKRPQTGTREERRPLPQAYDGQTRELRRPLGYLARRVYRHGRDRYPRGVRQEAHLPAARQRLQLLRDAPGRPKWA